MNTDDEPSPPPAEAAAAPDGQIQIVGTDTRSESISFSKEMHISVSFFLVGDWRIWTPLLQELSLASAFIA